MHLTTYNMQKTVGHMYGMQHQKNKSRLDDAVNTYKYRTVIYHGHEKVKPIIFIKKNSK